MGSSRSNIARLSRDIRKYFATWGRLLREPLVFPVLPESEHAAYVQPRPFLTVTLALPTVPALLILLWGNNGSAFATASSSALGLYVILGLFASVSYLTFSILGKPKKEFRASLHRLWRAFGYAYAGPVWLSQLGVIIALAIVVSLFSNINPFVLAIVMGMLFLTLILLPVFFSVSVIRAFFSIVWFPENGTWVRHVLDWLLVFLVQALIYFVPMLTVGAYTRSVSVTKLTDIEHEVWRRVVSLSQLERWHLRKFARCSQPVGLRPALMSVSEIDRIKILFYLDFSALDLERNSFGYNFDVQENNGQCLIHATPARYGGESKRSFFGWVVRDPKVPPEIELVYLATAYNAVFSADRGGSQASIFGQLVMDWPEEISGLFAKQLIRSNVRTSFSTVFVANSAEFRSLYDFAVTSIEGQIPRVHAAEEQLASAIAAGGTKPPVRNLIERLGRELSGMEQRVDDLKKITRFGVNLGYVRDEQLEELATYSQILELFQQEANSLIKKAKEE